MYHPDALDASILREAQSPASRWNVRESYARIAKKLRVDEETVRRRVSKMERNGVIGGWTVTPNPHLLGMESVGVYLEAPDTSKKSSLLEKLQGMAGVTSVQSFFGTSMLVFFDQPEGGSPEAQIRAMEEACGGKSGMTWNIKVPQASLQMSSTDWQILRSLRKGPRRRLNVIAKELGISTKTLNRRMERLVDGYAFYVEILVDFQRIAGLAFTLLVHYSDPAAKEAADPQILQKLGGSYNWSDTRSSPEHSVFSAFSDNLGEAEQTYQWVRNLSGVDEVKMGMQESRRPIGSWVDQQIESRSPPSELFESGAGQPGIEPARKIPAARKEPRPPKEEEAWWTGSLVEGKNVKVRIDPDLCMGTASCVALAPKVFRIDWAKKKSISEPAPLAVLKTKGTEPEALFLAAQSCPYGVIRIEDSDTGEQLFP